MKNDHGDDPFAPLLVGEADGRRVGDCRMTQQYLLDVGRGNILSALDDDVIDPAGDEQIAVVVQPASVVGGEPPFLGEPCCQAPVFAGDLVAPHPDLAGTAGRQLCSVVVADGHLHRGQGPTDRGEPATDRRVSGGYRLSMLVGTQQGHCGTGLGEPVGVHEPGCREEFQRPLDGGLGHLPSSVGKGPQRRQARPIGFLGGQVVDDPGQHGGHHHRAGH